MHYQPNKPNHAYVALTPSSRCDHRRHDVRLRNRLAGLDWRRRDLVSDDFRINQSIAISSEVEPWGIAIEIGRFSLRNQRPIPSLHFRKLAPNKGPLR